MRALFAAVFISLFATTAWAEEWANWRGPRYDGIVRAHKLPASLPEKAKEVWSIPVGAGYATPVAVDGRLYVFSIVDRNLEVLLCLEADSGKVVWRSSYEGAYTGPYPGTRASPVVEDKFIYTYGGNGDLVCWKRDGGEIAWRTNILKETSAKNQQWGVASNPTIEGDAIYVQGGVDGPAAVRVDKSTGKLRWKSEAKNGSYAQCILIEAGGVKQLIALGNKHLFGINPASGKTLWTRDWETRWDVNAATPVFINGQLLVTSGYGTGAALFKVLAGGVEEIWKNTSLQSRHQPVIVDGGHIYGNSEGVLRCLNWSDGQVKWEVKESGILGIGGTLLRAGDKLLALSERGKMTLLKATPDGVEKLGQTTVVDGREVWSTPLLYRGKLYIKGPAALLCLQLSGE